MTFSVKHKLMLGFGAVCALAAALALYQMDRFAMAMRVMSAVVVNDVRVTDMLRTVTEQQANLRSDRETALNTVSLARAQNRTADIGAQRLHYLEGTRQLLDSIAEMKTFTGERAGGGITDRRRAAWQEAANAVGDLDRAARAIVTEATVTFDLLERGQWDEAQARRPRLDELRRTLDERLEAIGAIIRRLNETGRGELDSIHQEVTASSIAALAGMVVLALVIAYLIGRSITRRLSLAIDFVGRVGDGDLTHSITMPGRDELTELGHHLGEMTARLRTVAGTTRGTAESVHAATAEIRASTQQQAASVAEQLAAVEETTATLSEITESGAQINRRAQDVARGAQAASTASDSGLRAVSDTNEAMNAIRDQAEAVAENIVLLSERTQAIGEIIVTVNDIAERSHLLALNAAIEAAAAGEHGRTFAIVANEIKSLADQAKEATAQVRSNLSEIQHGINASVMLTEEAVKRVAAGKRQTDATEATIREMAETIQESVIAFQQIVAGTNQQQIGLEQVIQALQNIREASTQTAAGTRQLEGAAGNLNALGQGLVDAVRNYRV
ncbi:methyl-accepting chemotaxis protein [Azospirillum sp. TSO22-1]|uniref:methyl-accepting chemotaxis protein n=1 Tax=Azospirillum sp. TSO22-1 TaxID=716789 RepID=UPI000D6172D7|nr:methyl-accepting chemotaxis protein [Azospirillum sp. TSO22-1]PWC42338.1 chemotaxis protein [Azospirillum sp. TSO22-1]